MGEVMKEDHSGGTQSSSIFGHVLYARPASFPATKGPESKVSATSAVVGKAKALSCAAALMAWLLWCSALGLGRSKLKVFHTHPA
mmetsp:Transcript_89200/g.109157  ORF Transcript_89200/g.109157 Transcript_89200/m.109157 type:complete len:85 (+) Transcript_89200:384-638(+)